MKRATRVVTLLLGIAMVAFLVSGCLITEIIQSLVVAAGGEFTTKVTITDKTADANPHEGALAILTPDDWEFVSGTYDSQAGKGAFIADPNTPPVYGDLDGKLPAPAGMKWIRLLTDAAYTNEANVVHEANITLKVGSKTGDFMIGYMATKNSVDMLGSINPLNEDNDNAWADTSMNHKVTVSGAAAAAVIFNEAFSRGTDEAPDYVELYNPSALPFDVSGYKVYDNGGQAGSKPKKEIPAGTVIAPWGFLAISVDNTGADSDFGLSSGGDKVWLEDAVGAVIDSVEFGALETTQSWARKPDAGLWQLSTIITKGFTNGDPTGVATAPRVVEGYLLTQNYPNPFNPSTRIDFTLPRQAEVQVAVYNLRGEMVAELVNGRLAAGSHQLTFNAEGLASGIYIYTIRSGEFTAAKRMVLMK
ncbi:MAG TPA: lamin tail domain-containing protein [bacterium]|nr:lamin tail domain-containing protein [bacterium]